MAYLFLAVAIIAEVIATTALKASASFSKPLPSLLVIVGYGAAFFFLSLCLRSIQVAVAYAIWSGLGIVLITIAAAAFYQQIPDRWAIIGMALIIAGVLVLNLLSNTVMH